MKNLKECYLEENSKLYKDSLFVFFENEFEDTPVNIKSKYVSLSDTLTSSNIGIAWGYNLGLKSDIDTFSFELGNWDVIEVSVDQNYGYIRVNLLSDTIYLDYERCLPVYE